MPANLFRGDYEQLAQIAQRFAREQDATQRMLENVRRQVGVLQGGDWVGQGAQAFYTEMNSAVLPSLKRLVQALQSAQRVTIQISRAIKQAEDEAAAVLKYDGSDSAAQGASGSATPTSGNATGSANAASSKGNAKGTDDWTWKDTLKVLGKTAMLVYKDRNAISSILAAGGDFSKMVRFVRDESGLWKAFGSQAAKEALGLPKNLTRFGEKAIEASLKNHSLAELFKSAVKADGPFSARAAQLLEDVKGLGVLKNAPLKSAAGFMKNFKGPAIVSSLITAGSDIFEYGWGANRNKGLLSREFLTSTGADLAAGGGIVAASTAIGTAIPIPGVGTAVGFAVGLGLQYAYDRWGKDVWRSAVDSASQHVAGWATDAYSGAKDLAGKAGGVAADVTHHIVNFAGFAGDVGSTVKNKVSDLAGGAMKALSFGMFSS